MEIEKSIEIRVKLTLKELSDLEDKSLSLTDGSEKPVRVFTIENAAIEKPGVSYQSNQQKDKPLMATATIVLNMDAKNVSAETSSLFKKLLKIK